ncbi:MAG: hypothetical protein ACI89U_002371 [Gammaproteobacteria bacterium]|jgi:hypothetical protein
MVGTLGIARRSRRSISVSYLRDTAEKTIEGLASLYDLNFFQCLESHPWVLAKLLNSLKFYPEPHQPIDTTLRRCDPELGAPQKSFRDENPAIWIEYLLLL